MTPDPAVLRKRAIRELILRLLRATFEGAPDIGVPYRQILEAFTGGRDTYTTIEIRAQLVDLVEDGLIEIMPAPAGGGLPSPGKIYRVTSRGRDFADANYPWHRVDEFSGRQ
ncbi:MAG: hypothetical protein ACYTF6_13560 [Planctomycetota bacterium]|jgi:hypothetical protein